MSNYYNDNAKPFFDNTVMVDMQPLYQAFLPLLPKKAKIVDAGCGSGRDTHYFLSQDLNVTAFDACEALVTLAAEHTQMSISCETFLSLDLPEKSQDGIWACASLLHVPFAELSTTFKHMATWLKPQGIFYCSFKYGHQTIQRGDRVFTNLDEERLKTVIALTPLSINNIWITEDQRKGRADEKWLNALLVKK